MSSPFVPLGQRRHHQSFVAPRGGRQHSGSMYSQQQQRDEHQNGGLADDAVEEEGFHPLRKARSEAAGAPGSSRFSFGTRAARENYTLLWERRDPWRMLKRNVSFRGGPAAAGGSARRESCVVIVDPFSSGAILAQRVTQEGFHCVRVFSEVDSPVAKLVQGGLTIEYDATFQFDDRVLAADDALEELIRRLESLPWPVEAILPGAETGVELADRLSNRIGGGVLSNGEELTEARRNKYLMGERVRSCGVRAVEQKMARSEADVEQFVAGMPPQEQFMAVVKPLESAGSDDVYLCSSPDQVRAAFARINGKVNGLGCVNEGALCQEFLDGVEYVVDSVSREGVHKVIAIWEYDKRSVNDSSFVYFGMRLRSVDEGDPRIPELVAYARSVLDAMGVRHGPGHMEVKYTSTGPCLVEVGTRCHGGEGTWQPIAKECVGYDQINATFDAYMMPERWQALPDEPRGLLKRGREVFLVARQSGMLRALPGLEEIRGFRSFRRMEMACKPRNFVHRTVDCFTRPGSVQLVDDDLACVERDYARIRRLEQRGLFDFEVICPVPVPTGAVVVVDPFSSGALLSALVLQRGLRCVMVFSEMDSPIAGLVQQGTSLQPDLTIQHDAAHPDQEAALQLTLAELGALPHPILAILPGAETGVELADRLSSRFGTRTNGEDIEGARRNKFFMGERVRSRGVRAARQRLATSEAELLAFLGEDCPPPVVVKPLESAGSDDVSLCHSVEEAVAAFRRIDGKVNGLGGVNEGALAQEFLDGTEYVVDSVSRDGVHKIAAVWEYDKRSINGANFIYFGMRLRAVGDEEDCRDPRIQTLVDYARSVLDAMGIEHGPGHMEVKFTSSGPCLVEVGSRCHGGEGTWQPIAQECAGVDQITLTLDCYVRPAAWDAAPMEPTAPLKAYGCEVFLVARRDGRVRSIPAIDIIRGLPSFRRMEMATQPGSLLRRTVDCFTRPGSVQLANTDPAALAADIERIRQLEEEGVFFDLSEEIDNLPPVKVPEHVDFSEVVLV
jgi:biotin carboxylase